MNRPLFLRIQSQVEAHDHYFVQKRNASGVSGLSSIQKVTAAMMILTHGVTMDTLDECLGIGESTVIESLKRFIKAVIELYSDEYLRPPNKDDIARLLAEGESRGFPGMLGSIDCMHWKWKNCPIKWRQKYVGHDHSYEPTVVFEGVASYDLWIWHAYFGLPWSRNDINIPEHSTLFVDLINGCAAPADYSINKRSYTMGYYLASDVYPPWSTVVKTNSEARNNRIRHFDACHESARKDVERAFEVLQSRFAFVRGPPRFWQHETLKHILSVCIIIHNMIVEDERDAMDLDFIYDELDENLRVARSHEHTTEFMEFLERYQCIKSEEANSQLQADLMEHLWQIQGRKPLVSQGTEQCRRKE